MIAAGRICARSGTIERRRNNARVVARLSPIVLLDASLRVELASGCGLNKGVSGSEKTVITLFLICHHANTFKNGVDGGKRLILGVARSSEHTAENNGAIDQSFHQHFLTVAHLDERLVFAIKAATEYITQWGEAPLAGNAPLSGARAF